jgi:hypothetical protein
MILTEGRQLLLLKAVRTYQPTDVELVVTNVDPDGLRLTFQYGSGAAARRAEHLIPFAGFGTQGVPEVCDFFFRQLKH